MKCISSHSKPFQTMFFQFFWVGTPKKFQRLSTLFAIGGGSSDPLWNIPHIFFTGYLRKSAQPRGGLAKKVFGLYIYLSFQVFFLFFTQKCAFLNVYQSKILNCIFSGRGMGGGLWQKIKFLNAISIDLRVGGLGTFPYLNKFFKGFL